MPGDGLVGCVGVGAGWGSIDRGARGGNNGPIGGPLFRKGWAASVKCGRCWRPGSVSDCRRGAGCHEFFHCPDVL